ncbi:Uu.00g011010.m01.CDS01 [Anthostomella pinea]|uniref:Uu.00g011010.m01.CDS01 n=1 Tax=Anthostomella pinea TaxID=933095 RepID=A0AAI8VXP0_9PEZI|nr:Uu.00g011010.m01.CDS01 [Anthostomella pinea]
MTQTLGVSSPHPSTQIIWTYCAFNVVTNAYLISIPIPMLWASRLRPVKKVGLVALFGGGLAIVVFSFLRTTIIYQVSSNKIPSTASLAASWALQETFLSVFTTNASVIFPLFHSILAPVFGTLVRSVRESGCSRSKDGKGRSIKTIGGGGKNQSWRGRRPRTPNPITKFTFSESEERMMVNQGQQVPLGNMDMQMNPMKAGDVEAGNGYGRHDGGVYSPYIRKDVEVDVTSVVGVDPSQQFTCHNNFVYAHSLGRPY